MEEDVELPDLPRPPVRLVALVEDQLELVEQLLVVLRVVLLQRSKQLA